jgi:hypothetical protein
MEARGNSSIAIGAAILVIVLGATAAVSPGAFARRGLGITRAEAAARHAVLVDRSYRRITSTRSGLVTRRCWRVSAVSVRCSLYVVAPDPCALDPERSGVCVQALWERRWLVEVRRRRGGVGARIVKISSGPLASAH